MEFKENILYIQDKKIEFENKIALVLNDDERYYVMTAITFNPSTHRNIFCYDKAGKFLWRISMEKAKRLEDAFIGLKIRNHTYIATDFFGFDLSFNPYTGKIKKRQ